MNLGNSVPSIPSQPSSSAPPPMTSGWWHDNRKIVAIVGVAVVVMLLFVFFLLFVGQGRRGTLTLPGILEGRQAAVPVSLTTEYKNPFDRDSQYVNPFQEFKSPFHSLQQ